MVKYSLDFKLNIVKDYFDNNLGVNYLTKKYHLPTHTIVRKWIKAVQVNGYQALMPKRHYRHYSLKFKLKVVNYYQNSSSGLITVAAHFNISSSQVYSWYCRFKQNGIAGLRECPRGRRPMKKKNNSKTNKKPTALTKEERYQQRITELENVLYYTKMENDI